MSRSLTTTALATAAALAGAALVGACGDDDTNAGQATAAAKDVPDVVFAGSPESGVPVRLPQPKQEALTIGLLNPLRSTEVLKVMFDAAKEQITELGGTSIELDAQVDPNRQVSQFEQLLSEKVDAIAVVPIASPKLLGPLLKRAAKQGVPVIGMDALPGVPGPLPGFVTDIWQRRDHMVYLQVKAAAEALGPGAKVGLIGYQPPAPLFEFAEARTAYWAKRFGLDLVEKVEAPADSIAVGNQVAARLLTEHPEIKGILGYNDEPAIGAMLAARSAGRRDVKTFGACCGLSLGRSALANGRLSASVAFDAEAYGRMAAIAAYDVVQGVKVPPEVLGATPTIVTADDVGEAKG